MATTLLELRAIVGGGDYLPLSSLQVRLLLYSIKKNTDSITPEAFMEPSFSIVMNRLTKYAKQRQQADCNSRYSGETAQGYSQGR